MNDINRQKTLALAAVFQAAAIADSLAWKGIADKEATYLPSIGAAEANKKKFLAQLHTAEQRRVYFGIVAEILLDNGINIARQMNKESWVTETKLLGELTKLKSDLTLMK